MKKSIVVSGMISLMLSVGVAQAQTTYTWTQTAGGAQNWSTGSNWSGGSAPSPVAGDTVDFSTVNIVGDTTLNIGGARTAETFRFGDTGGGQTWIVNSAGSAITGNIAIHSGSLEFASLAAWGGAGKDLTFTGNGTLLAGAHGYTGGQLIVNPGVTATIQPTITFASATGSGTVVIGLSNPRTLSLQDASNFTGALHSLIGYAGGQKIQFRTLSDAPGSGNLVFGGSSSDSGQRGTIALYGNVGPLTLNNRHVEILQRPSGNHGISRSILENNNSTPANKWVINTPLLYHQNYARSLELGGSNTGDNEFAGAISNGDNGGSVRVNKVGNGTWSLSGINTYSGITTVSGGILKLEGEQSLSDSGVLNITSGKVDIRSKERVMTLQLGGVPQSSGTWGSTSSVAQYQNDTYFTGKGLLYVNVDFPPKGTVIILK